VPALTGHLFLLRFEVRQLRFRQLHHLRVLAGLNHLPRLRDLTAHADQLIRRLDDRRQLGVLLGDLPQCGRVVQDGRIREAVGQILIALLQGRNA
jgi:hypothetical protein